MQVAWDNFGWGLIYFLACIAGGVAVGLFAESRGHKFSPAFWLSFVTSPVGSFLIVLMLPEKDRPKRDSLEVILALERAKLEANRASGARQHAAVSGEEHV
jgi:hypothetical protein